MSLSDLATGALPTLPVRGVLESLPLLLTSALAPLEAGVCTAANNEGLELLGTEDTGGLAPLVLPATSV